MATTLRKGLVMLLLVAATSAVAAYRAYTAFSATPAVPAGAEGGAVQVGDGARAALTVLSRSTARCVRVTFDGSSTASIRLHLAHALHARGALELRIERGRGLSAPGRSCAGFRVTSTAYHGPLGSLGATHGDGVDGKAGGAAWRPGDSVDYRLTLVPPRGGAST